MARTDYKKLRTIYGLISGTGDSEFTTTALSAETGQTSRGVRRRRFAGAIISNKNESGQALTPKISITNGSVAGTYELDLVNIPKGGTETWTEEDYAVDLDKDEYVKIDVAESLLSGDRLYIAVRINDMYA